jgi:hypothetical protein
MIHRTYYSHYRLIREVTTVAVTLGAAMLLGYLVLWARL